MNDQLPATGQQFAFSAAPPSLADLWQKTEGVLRDGSGTFICLRLKSEGKPIGFLPNKNWLASVERIRDDQWEVSLWTRVLRDFCAYDVKDADTPTAEKILIAVRDIKPDNWWIVAQPLEKDHPMTLRNIG